MYLQYYMQGQIGRHKCATRRTYGGLFLPIFPVSQQNLPKYKSCTIFINNIKFLTLNAYVKSNVRLYRLFPNEN